MAFITGFFQHSDVQRGPISLEGTYLLRVGRTESPPRLDCDPFLRLDKLGLGLNLLEYFLDASL